jgi:phosphodiesterase/alkaline phosphatase D-like protein
VYWAHHVADQFPDGQLDVNLRGFGPSGQVMAPAEAVAQGNDGPPLGRELEIAQVLTALRRKQVRNTVWLTADVHYTAAHYYDPSRAAYPDFDPFWEFVSGPLNAGAFGPNQLDATFGPQVMFAETPPHANTSPAEGFQYFGEVTIEAASSLVIVVNRVSRGSRAGSLSRRTVLSGRAW